MRVRLGRLMSAFRGAPKLRKPESMRTTANRRDSLRRRHRRRRSPVQSSADVKGLKSEFPSVSRPCDIPGLVAFLFWSQASSPSRHVPRAELVRTPFCHRVACSDHPQNSATSAIPPPSGPCNVVPSLLGLPNILVPITRAQGASV